MKILSAKLLSLLLAAVMLLSCFVACARTDDDTASTGPADTQPGGTQAEESEAATQDPAKVALENLQDVDYGGKTFAILYEEGFKGEVYGENGIVGNEGGDDQVINDAVYQRNVLLEEMCKLTFETIPSTAASITTDVQNASMSGEDIAMIDATLMNSANFSVSGFLYNYLDLGVDIDQPWWDVGTADFELDGKVFFMSGDVNFADDNMTFVLLFNKKLREEYAKTVENPYDTVLNWEWTLDHFNTVIQGISADEGDGQWDEKDKYGFVTTWEFGNTFFIGSDLRYIVADQETGLPSLYLSDASKMEKALDVLKRSQAIFHENNATYISPPGKENLGLEIFKSDRALFYSEIASYLKEINRSSDTEFGVLPVPKYDKAQEYYRTWTYPGGSALSVSSAIKDPETIGQIVEVYAILSHQYVKPAFYDITLTTKTVKDAESEKMLDLIFQNRIYDMALYYQTTFGKYFDLFKQASYENKDTFQSGYKGVSKSFNRNLSKFQDKLDKLGAK